MKLITEMTNLELMDNAFGNSVARAIHRVNNSGSEAYFAEADKNSLLMKDELLRRLNRECPGCGQRFNYAN